jgi:hypothetical protein
MKRTTRQNHNHAIGAVPDTPPLNTRRKTVRLTEVECPECKAKIGEPCLSRTGKVKTCGCTARKRMATRLDNEVRDAEH